MNKIFGLALGGLLTAVFAVSAQAHGYWGDGYRGHGYHHQERRLERADRRVERAYYNGDISRWEADRAHRRIQFVRERVQERRWERERYGRAPYDRGW